MINDWCLGIIQVQQAIYLVLSTCCFIWTTAKPFGRSTDETVCCWGELHYSLKWHANANFQLAQAGFPFSLHTSLTFLSSLFFPPFHLSLSSGLQCDLLHQLFLSVLWQQWIGHDCSALPVRGNQHRFLECIGRADRGALPIRQEVGHLGMPWNLLDTCEDAASGAEWRVEWRHESCPALIGRLAAMDDIVGWNHW